MTVENVECGDMLRSALETVVFPSESTTKSGLREALEVLKWGMGTECCKGVIMELERVLGDYEEDYVLENAMTLLGCLCEQGRVVEDVKGGIVVEIMCKRKKNIVVQREGLKILTKLGGGERIKGGECGIWAMREFGREVFDVGCQVVKLVCESEEGRKRVGKVGGVQVLIEGVKEGWGGLECLENVLQCECNAWMGGRIGGVEIVMGRGREGLRCLKLLIRVWENRQRALELGIVDLLIDLLKIEGDEEDILQVLEIVIKGGEGAELAQGALDGCLRALKRGDGVALRVLRWLFFAERNRIAIGERIRYVVDVIREGYYVEEALYALGNALCEDNVKRIVARWGGVCVILQCMKESLECEGVQEGGVRCLRNLASGDEVNVRLVLEGGVEGFVLAIMACKENKQVQLHAVGGLWNLSFCELGVRKIIRAGVVSVLKHVLKFQGGGREVELLLRKLEERD